MFSETNQNVISNKGGLEAPFPNRFCFVSDELPFSQPAAKIRGLYKNKFCNIQFSVEVSETNLKYQIK